MEKISNKNLLDEHFRKECHIERLLKANPYSKQNMPDATYSGELSVDFFNQNFLYFSKSYISILEETVKQLSDPNPTFNAYKIIGDAHCGKTTFVYSLKNKLEQDQSFFVDIIEFADAGGKTLYSTKYGAIDDILRNKLLNLIWDDYGNPKEIKNNNKLKIKYCALHERMNSKTDYPILHRKKGNNTLFDFLKEESYAKHFDMEMEKKLDSLDTIELLIYYILLQGFYIEKKSKKLIVFFENLDNLFTEDIQRLFDCYNEVQKVFSHNVLKDLDVFSDKVNSFYRFFSFIFVMRDVSDLLVNSTHFIGPGPQSIIIDNSTDNQNSKKLSPIDEIIMHRLKFIKNNPSSFSKNIVEQSKHLSKIFDKKAALFKYDKDYDFFFQLFDQDYIKIIDMFCDIISKNNLEYFDKLLAKTKVAKSPQLASIIKFGARSYFLRLIFNEFRKRDCFKNLGIRPDKSLPRTILYYCLNKKKNNVKNVSFLQIYQRINPVYDRSEIVDCCVQMFKLRESDKRWNQLISIEYAGTNEEHQMQRYMDEETQKQKGEEIIMIQITNAGKTFADKVSPHFEYFSCRYAYDYSPLFDEANLKIASGKYIFENIIEIVQKQVEKCIKLCFAKERELKETHFIRSWDEYKQEYCLPYTYEGNRNYFTHPERILHHHISYIDAYRVFVITELLIQNKKEEAKRINTKLILLIKNYSQMFKFFDNDYLSAFSTHYVDIINDEIEKQKQYMEEENFEQMKNKIYNSESEI